MKTDLSFEEVMGIITVHLRRFMKDCPDFCPVRLSQNIFPAIITTAAGIRNKSVNLDVEDLEKMLSIIVCKNMLIGYLNSMSSLGEGREGG